MPGRRERRRRRLRKVRRERAEMRRRCRERGELPPDRPRAEGYRDPRDQRTRWTNLGARGVRISFDFGDAVEVPVDMSADDAPELARRNLLGALLRGGDDER